MQRFPLLEPTFLRFCGRMMLRIPGALWQASKGWTTFASVFALYLAFSPELQAWGLSLFGGISPLWALVPVGLLFLLGLMRAPFEEYQRLREEKDALEQERETEEKRAAIGFGLQRLYDEGVQLRAEIFNSTDETPASECNERLTEWRQSVIGYFVENVSAGKAQYVDGITSVTAVFRTGMKSEATRNEKESILSHLEERLKRLAKVMSEY